MVIYLPQDLVVFLSLIPSGKHLGTIKTGQATSNVAFNSDETVLFMTADSYVLKIGLH